MADFTFECPSCKQAVQCDDAWSGHQIQCPICQAAIVVPANAPAAAHPPAQHTKKEVANLGHQLVSVPTGTKLATAQSTKVARSSFGPGKRFEQKQVQKRSPVVTVAIVAAVLVALGAAGYMGYPYVLKLFNKDSSQTAQPAKPSGGDEQAAAANPAGDAGAQPADAAPAVPAPNTNAVVAPKYTLDVAKAEIPDGKANGTIAGTNFVCETARLDRSGASYVLSLRQGKGLSPDRGVAVYLRLNAGETMPTNRNLTISQDTTGTTVSKIWKTDPKYAAKTQNYFKGYALKLELGAVSETGTVPGKIYLALPDTEKSVVAGNFTATTASATGQPGYDAAAQAQPTPVEGGMDAAARQRFQQRYGIKR